MKMAEKSHWKRAGGAFGPLLAILALAALVLGVWASMHWFGGGRAVPVDFPGTVLPGPGKALPPFELQDQHGRPFGPAQLQGHWSLVFFGYTHCPDICPTTLATLSQVYDGLARTAGGADDIAVLFVSVDPQRDSPQQIGGYLDYFNPAFTGVTGDEAALQTFSQALGAVYLRHPGDGRSGYLVDHSAALFIVAPNGRFKAVVTPPLDVADLVAGIDGLRG